MKNLIYVCVFHQVSYVKLLKLLLNSLKEYGNVDWETTDLCIVTSQDLVPIIKDSLDWFNENFKFYIPTEVPNTLFGAGCARLHIFSYEHIHMYDKILYLDTDILIAKDINVLYNLNIGDDKLYTLEEGTINHEYHGKQFFDTSNFRDKISEETTAFTSGILFFRNSDSIKDLFNTILNHIKDHIEKQYTIPVCLDQPFIVYHAISTNKYDNQLLKSYVENKHDYTLSNKIIYHFPYSPGNFNPKYERMTNFYCKIIQEKLNQKDKFMDIIFSGSHIPYFILFKTKDAFSFKYKFEYTLV
jgi:hypothetical protein